MIFLCFANADRYSIAEPVLYHFENFGIPMWYDRHSLVIGDNREEVNFKEGIISQSYCVLIITKNIESNVCANEEIEIVKSQYELGKMRVFPILYNIIADELPEKYYWMKEIIYREVTDSSGTLMTVSSIVYRYLKDKLQSFRYKNLFEIKDVLADNYLCSLLKTYYSIDNNNLNAKMTILYCFNYYLYSIINTSLPLYCTKPFELLFSKTKLNIEIDFKELSILETSVMLSLKESCLRNVI